MKRVTFTFFSFQSTDKAQDVHSKCDRHAECSLYCVVTSITGHHNKTSCVLQSAATIWAVVIITRSKYCLPPALKLILQNTFLKSRYFLIPERTRKWLARFQPLNLYVPLPHSFSSHGVIKHTPEKSPWNQLFQTTNRTVASHHLTTSSAVS
jgi:hypothetical protein